MTSERLGLLVLLAALPLSGCQELCDEGAVTWCPRSEDDALNDAPFVRVMEARLEAGTDPGGERLTAVFRAVAGDPDEDPIAYEWDLDGDGEFEQRGPLVSRSCRAGSRLHGAASFRFRLERDGTATAVGRLRARIGPKRPLPRRCRRLVPRGVR